MAGALTKVRGIGKKGGRLGLAATVMGAALALASAHALAGGKDAVPAYGTGTAADWPGPGGAADETGYSRLDQVNKGNIGRLGLAWSLDLPGEVTLEATPLAVDGTIYFSGSYSAVYAVDGASGKLLWKYDPEIWKHDPGKMRLNFGANRGVAYDNGRVFVATFDGRMIALDAKSGKELWTAQAIADGAPYFSTGAPRTFKGKVIIGNGGGDFGSRGYVTAFDQATGKQLWRFYTAPGSPEENKGDPAQEAAAKTWTGEYWKTGTGGTAWNGMTFDPEMNRIYIGTGNSGPYDPRVRSPGGGDNLYLVSIVALDADTGKYVWHYQMNPREAWDYKATANMVATTLSIEGKPRKVLMQLPTNGFYYVLDRETGKLISAEKTGKVTWADHIDLATGRPVEAPNIRYETGETSIWPGSIGGHNWQAMAFSPQTGLTYIPVVQAGLRFSKKQYPGDLPLAGMRIGWAAEGDDEGTAWLLAWDPAKQKQVWKVKASAFLNGGALATAGGLVFQGTGDGILSGYDALTGNRVWQFNAGHGIEAAPISYAAKDGTQYVAVLAGYGGSASVGGKRMQTGWKYGAQPRRLLAFKIDGQAKLPPTAPADRSVKALDDPSLALKEEDVKAGQQLFMACALCHGRDGESSGTAPDLRESAVALDFDSLWTVVHDGALLPKGMPRFEDLTRDQVHQIYSYIRARAREALGTRKPDVGGQEGVGRM
jgi:quinohemoprotein ethanol dehydrogenase